MATWLSVALIIIEVLLAGVGSTRFTCENPGNFSVPGSCTAYLECQESNATLPLPRSCDSNQAFSPILRRCVDETLVKGCNTTLRFDERTLVHAPFLDHLCVAAPNEYLCANCKTLVNCVNGRAYPSVCGTGDFCYRKDESFGSHVCYPGQPRSCRCQDYDVFYSDYYDKGSFFRCDRSGDTHIHQCPDGHVFDELSVQCKNLQGLPACVKPGVFALLEDCTRYYACIITTEGWLQHEFSCFQDNGPAMYSEETGRCEDPCLWVRPDFECQSEGRFADPKDCRKFYVCTRDANTGDFRVVSRQCPEGFEWEQTLRDGSGRCVPMTSERCRPAFVSQCHIPEGLCS